MPRYLTLESELGDRPSWLQPRKTFAEWSPPPARITQEEYKAQVRAERDKKASEERKKKEDELRKLQASLFQHYDPVRGWSGGDMGDEQMKSRIEEALGLDPADTSKARRTFQQRQRFCFKTQAQARLERKAPARLRRRVRAPGADSPEARVYQMLSDNGEEFDELEGWFKKAIGAVSGAAKSVGGVVKAAAAPLKKAATIAYKPIKTAAKATGKTIAHISDTSGLTKVGRETGKAFAMAGETTAKGFAKYVEDSWSIKNWNNPAKFGKMFISGGTWGTVGTKATTGAAAQAASPYTALLTNIAKSAAQATAAYVVAKEGGDTKASTLLTLAAGKAGGKFGEALEALPLVMGKPSVMQRDGENVTFTTQGADGGVVETGYNLGQLDPFARNLPNGVPILGDVSGEGMRDAMIGGAMAPVAGGNDETASADSPSLGAIVAKETAMPILLTLGAVALVFMALKSRTPSTARSY